MNLKIEYSPVTLREICLNKLRNAIVSGYFSSGKRLVERSLCEELGVSRSVVREVIRYLEAEGLVEVLPKKGPIVSLLSWEVAQQIYEIRLLLEQSAVADCTLNLTDEIASNIRVSLESLRRSFASDDINDVLLASAHLYETIFSAANHHIAWDIVRRQNGRISRLRAMTLRSTDRPVTGYQRIKNICEAIYLHKDPALAKQAVADHIREASSIAKRLLQETGVA